MTRDELEAAITNLIRTKNLLIIAQSSAETARLDAAATLQVDHDQAEHLRLPELSVLVARRLRELKSQVYDDAKAKGEI
jgi:hypothetical protein